MIDIRQGDCFELLKTIPDKSIDFILTDPPYEFKSDKLGGTTSGLSKRKYKEEVFLNPNLNKKFDAGQLLSEIERICKNVNCVIFCTEIMLFKLMRYAIEHDYIYAILCWCKTNPIPYTNNGYLKDVELAIMIRSSKSKCYGNYETLSKFFISTVNASDKKKYEHPTIKPLEFCKKLIINHTKKGDTVLDMYMGAGTTGVAAKQLGRNFIGFEINEKYFNIAKERINAPTEQDLFSAEED